MAARGSLSDCPRIRPRNIRHCQLQASCIPVHGNVVRRQTAAVKPLNLVPALPALGDVLYVPMQSCDAIHKEMPLVAPVEQWQLAPLLRVRWLVQASVAYCERTDHALPRQLTMVGT